MSRDGTRQQQHIFALFRVRDLHLHLFKVGSKQPSGAASLAKFVVVNWAIFSNGESATVLAFVWMQRAHNPILSPLSNGVQQSLIP